MGMREWMNENSSIVTGAAVVLLVVAIWVAIRQVSPGGPQTVGEVWYSDTQTGKLFKADREKIPPITSPDGNTAVRAHLFGCGDCSEANRFVGYYERYSDKAKQVLEQAEQALAAGDDEAAMEAEMRAEEASMSGLMYSVDGKEWFPAQSRKGEFVTSEGLEKKCEGKGDLVPCKD